MPDLLLIVIASGGVAGLMHGVAAVVREVYRGKALLLRAQRGDPELTLLVERPKS